VVINRLFGWLTGWTVGRLDFVLNDRLASAVDVWLAGWYAVRLAGWSTVELVGLLAC
jgi:hypothetical protein